MDELEGRVRKSEGSNTRYLPRWTRQDPTFRAALQLRFQSQLQLAQDKIEGMERRWADLVNKSAAREKPGTGKEEPQERHSAPVESMVCAWCMADLILGQCGLPARVFVLVSLLWRALVLCVIKRIGLES